MEDRLIISCVFGLEFVDVPVYARHGEWAITPPIVGDKNGKAVAAKDGTQVVITHAPTGLRLCTVNTLADALAILTELPERTDLGMCPAMDAEEYGKVNELQKHSVFAPVLKAFIEQHDGVLIR